MVLWHATIQFNCFGIFAKSQLELYWLITYDDNRLNQRNITKYWFYRINIYDVNFSARKILIDIYKSR